MKRITVSIAVRSTGYRRLCKTYEPSPEALETPAGEVILYQSNRCMLINSEIDTRFKMFCGTEGKLLGNLK